MKAMILAAGFGMRLRPLTETLPKPLLPIAGKPLIEWTLLLLRRHGVMEVMINLHHLGDQIEHRLGDGSRFGMRLSYSREAAILGTGGGIKQAEPFFEWDPFIVLNGDTLLELDLGALVGFHRQQGALATMVVRQDPEVERWGAVEVGEEHRVLRINGRGLPRSEPVDRFMFAGVHVMHPRLLRNVPLGQEASIIDVYVSAIVNGDTISGYPMEGYWSDVGTLARYQETQREVEAGLVTLDARRGEPA